MRCTLLAAPAVGGIRAASNRPANTKACRAVFFVEHELEVIDTAADFLRVFWVLLEK